MKSETDVSPKLNEDIKRSRIIIKCPTVNETMPPFYSLANKRSILLVWGTGRERSIEAIPSYKENRRKKSNS